MCVLMYTVMRKVTFKLYPTPSQAKQMLDVKGAHQRLYNAASASLTYSRPKS